MSTVPNTVLRSGDDVCSPCAIEEVLWNSSLTSVQDFRVPGNHGEFRLLALSRTTEWWAHLEYKIVVGKLIPSDAFL